MFRYLDLSAGQEFKSPEPLFPGWSPDKERVAVFSPHDDDALLGAGYLILAMLAEGAAVDLIIFCDGRAGYSRPEARESIIVRRGQETRKAYQRLGLPPEAIQRLDLPDFSVPHYLGWKLPAGGEGLFARLIPLLRRLRPTRLCLPNGWREHLDHTGVYQAGVFFGPQVGDAILADWGQAPAVRSVLVYSVWGDFPPAAAGSRELRADRAILAPAEVEERVRQCLQDFASQAEVLAPLVQARSLRLDQGRALELYQTLDPRPALDYRPYWPRVRALLK
jgi:hypothetical protein